MFKANARHVSTNIPSARTTVKSASSRRTLGNDVEFIDYSLIDTARKETINKQWQTYRSWTAKFDPWLIEEYREMYENIAKVHGISRPNGVISLKRTEWQQPNDVFPPLHKRLTGQKRRRILGAFPETENDKIGWRALPEQTFNKYERIQTATSNPLPNRYKFSQWPIESFY